MSQASSIEWTDATWNPTRGCTKVSPGCKYCYAEAFAERFRGVEGHPYEDGFDPRMVPDKLAAPLHWRTSRRVFVNSMSDLFMDEVADEYIDQVFGVMSACEYLGRDARPGHTFQVLTKRAARMREYFSTDRRVAWARAAAEFGGGIDPDGVYDAALMRKGPMPHVLLGVSVEDQRYGVPRIEHLRATPAALRFLSIEPLLEDVGDLDLTGIGWVIVGGESGQKARPFEVAWARNVVAQCRAQRVPCFVKQMGARPMVLPVEGAPAGLVRLRLGSRKGNDPAEWPLMEGGWPRQFPEVPRV